MPSPARLPPLQRSELSRQEEEFRELFGDVTGSQSAGGEEDDLIAEFRSEDEDSSAEEDGQEEEEEYLGTQVRYRRDGVMRAGIACLLCWW